MKTLFAFLIFTFSSALYAQTETVITGKLLGHDGKPMEQTDIHKYEGTSRRIFETVHAGKDGSFTFATKDTGQVIVKFAGLFHLSEDVPFLIDKPAIIRIEVRLGTYRCSRQPKEMTIFGTFNNWTMAEALPMKREADGTFTAEFETKDDKFGYEVIGSELTGRGINGTQFAYNEYDGEGDYRSFVTPRDGKVKIVYDVTKALSSADKPRIDFEDPTSRVAKYTMIKWRASLRNREISEAYRTFIDAGGDSKDFKFEKDRSAELPQLFEQLKTENDPIIHQLLLFDYLSISGDKGDAEVARTFIRELPQILKDYPRGRLYELMGTYVGAGGILKFGEEFKRSFSDLLDSLPDANLKGNFANNLLSSLQSKKYDTLALSYYELVSQKLAGNPYMSIIKDRFGSKSTLAVGKQVPVFVVKSFDDPAVTYSNETFKGKVYLIHFWATWNGPSVSEMENIHKAYEKFRSMGFEILSLSLDAKPEQIRKFREGKWKMPWLHAYVTTDKKVLGDFSSAARTLKPILIDGEGKIIALLDELQGDKLQKTLARVLKVVD